MESELKQIVAQETIKLIMEQSEDCTKVRVDDLNEIEKLFKNICDVLNGFIEGKRKELAGGKSAAKNDGMSGIGGGKAMPSDSRATHTVVAGDTYWDLARKYLGDPKRWKEIVRANNDLLKNRPKRIFKSRGNQNPPPIPVIRPGDELNIPAR